MKSINPEYKEDTNMAYKSSRKLKVYKQSGYRYKPTTTITLKGKWLEELSFPIGMPIIVKCKDGADHHQSGWI
jgi:hypothetical protein